MLSDSSVKIKQEMEAIRARADRLQRHAESLERTRRQDDRRTAKSTQAEVQFIRKGQNDANTAIRELKEASEKQGAVLDQMKDMMKTLNQRQVHDHDIAMSALQVREDVARASAMITQLHMLAAENERSTLLQGKLPVLSVLLAHYLTTML